MLLNEWWRDRRTLYLLRRQYRRGVRLQRRCSDDAMRLEMAMRLDRLATIIYEADKRFKATGSIQ